jgi:hypothetical protein
MNTEEPTEDKSGPARGSKTQNPSQASLVADQASAPRTLPPGKTILPQGWENSAPREMAEALAKIKVFKLYHLLGCYDFNSYIKDKGNGRLSVSQANAMANGHALRCAHPVLADADEAICTALSRLKRVNPKEFCRIITEATENPGVLDLNGIRSKTREPVPASSTAVRRRLLRLLTQAHDMTGRCRTSSSLSPETHANLAELQQAIKATV